MTTPANIPNRVARTAALLAQALGVAAEQVALIWQAAPLHDVEQNRDLRPDSVEARQTDR